MPKMSKAISAAQSPAARKKAVESNKRSYDLRLELAEKYNTHQKDFQKPKIMETIARLNIPISEVAEELLPPNVRKQVKNALAMQGTGIPLDLIPGKPERKVYGAAVPVKKGNPNEAIIMRILDTIEKDTTPESVSNRLLAVLEKLV